VIIDRSVLTEKDREIEKGMSLAKAFSPWIILIAALLIVAFVHPVDQFLRVKMAMPVSMIPNVVTNVRLFWNAYFWVFLSTFLSMFILRPKKGQFGKAMANWMRRAPKPVITTIVFYVIGYLLNYSGYQVMEDGSWMLQDTMQNMVSVLSDSSALAFGSLYPLIVAPLGLFGGFITSSEASTLAMFSKYNILTSEQLGLNALVVTAATGIGGGLASVISPAKLQNASATIDAVGEENDVIKETFKISCVLVAVVAVMCWWFCKF
jgi:lactate permease